MPRAAVVIVAVPQDPAGAYPETTGVAEAGDRLYTQSLHAGHVGWLPKAAALSKA